MLQKDTELNTSVFKDINASHGKVSCMTSFSVSFNGINSGTKKNTPERLHILETILFRLYNKHTLHM